MKEIYVLCGKGRLTAEIPDRNLQAVLSPQKIEAGDERETVRAALRAPIGSPTLAELSRGARSVVIISSDNTRPMPSRITLPLILEALARPAEEYDLTVLIATGLHRPMTREEIAERFGSEIMAKCKIVNHMAEDEASLAFAGTSQAEPHCI